MRKVLPVLNFALLQWRVRLDTSRVILSSEAYRKKAGLLDVTDGAAQCGLITIARRTRPTSSDKSATASNAGSLYAIFIKKRNQFFKLTFSGDFY